MSVTAAIIQARMGSKRLPGKSLVKVYKNLSLLEMVCMRTLKADSVNTVILATSEEANCDPLNKLADRLGIATVRGSETDVLSRFVKAVNYYQPDSVVRICADNPLIDPGEIDKLVAYFNEGTFDYAANNTIDCGLPDGLGCEIIKSSTLLDIDRKAHDQLFREHVTNYITEHSEHYHAGWLTAEPELQLPDLKLDIDTEADLETMKRFCAGMPEKNAPYWTAYDIVMNAKSLSVQ